MNKILPPWPHQGLSLEVYDRTPHVFDLSDAGTGKTRAAIDAFVKHGKRALVVAPKALLETAWLNDINKFAPHLRTSVAYASNRTDAFSVPADVYITNTDATRWLAKQPASFFKTFDTLIIDESSYFKNRTSQRSKAMMKISHNFDRKALLTATPTSVSITDIWHQAKILDGGKRLGNSFFKFRETVCESKPTFGTFVKWVDRPEAYASVAQILSDIRIRHLFPEVMKSVPGNKEHYVKYTPSPKLIQQYNKLKEDAIIMVQEGAVTAVNAAALRQKLLQVASGTVYGEDGSHVFLDNQRIELVGELVYQREHSVVFYNWKHQRDALRKELTKRKISFIEISSDTPDDERLAIVDRYQSGDYQTILMHPQTGAHGLTLTRGTAVIWCSPSDRADLLVQGKHRVYRGGQTKETENIMVCSTGTLEAGVYANTDRKRTAMTDLLELLQ